ncbi:MAG: arylamine N-acetyltransferase [Taibaiella sp.]|nr:arylamine N-acetyltransferase [Taibaiella sp.]
MNESRYLNRIGYTGTPMADLATLKSILRCHVANIPFENLDIFYKTSYINLDLRAIYDKIVNVNRGGYCYELNGLLCWLLKSIGFKVTMVAGRVARKNGYGPEMDHMALLVHLDDNKWLVDAGFGDFSTEPILIGNSNEPADFRLVEITVDSKKYLDAQKRKPATGQYTSEYIFTLKPHNFEDFAQRNHRQQTEPGSFFLQNLICSIPVKGGRYSIVNNRFVETISGIKKITLIGTSREQAQLLKQYFNMDASLVAVRA